MVESPGQQQLGQWPRLTTPATGPADGNALSIRYEETGTLPGGLPSLNPTPHLTMRKTSDRAKLSRFYTIPKRYCFKVVKLQKQAKSEKLSQTRGG